MVYKLTPAHRADLAFRARQTADREARRKLARAYGVSEGYANKAAGWPLPSTYAPVGPVPKRPPAQATWEEAGQTTQAYLAPWWKAAGERPPASPPLPALVPLKGGRRPTPGLVFDPGRPPVTLTMTEATKIATVLEDHGWRAEAILVIHGYGLVEVRDLTVRCHPLIATLRGPGDAEAFRQTHGHGLRGRVPTTTDSGMVPVQERDERRCRVTQRERYESPFVLGVVTGRAS